MFSFAIPPTLPAPVIHSSLSEIDLFELIQQTESTEWKKMNPGILGQVGSSLSKWTTH